MTWETWLPLERVRIGGLRGGSAESRGARSAIDPGPPSVPTQTVPERSSVRVKIRSSISEFAFAGSWRRCSMRPGRRIENVDARIAGSDPDPAVRVHQHGARGIARERGGIGGIVPKDREAVGRPVPAGDTCILDRDPQIVMRILDDLIDEVARQPAAGAGRVGIADQSHGRRSGPDRPRCRARRSPANPAGSRRPCPAAGHRRSSDARGRAGAHRPLAPMPATANRAAASMIGRRARMGIHPVTYSPRYDARSDALGFV